MAQDDIQGQVVDAQGNPVSGAIVELTKSYQSSPDTRGDVFRTTTDSNGNYIFTGHQEGDGTTQEWHVSAYNHDGTAYVNSFNNPGVTADLPSNAIPDTAIVQFDARELSLSDGDTVSTWPENVAGNDATAQGAPKYRNSAINGNPAVELDGTDDAFDAATPNTAQPVTVFGVVDIIDDTQDNVFVSTDTNANTTQWFNAHWLVFAGSGLDGSTDSTKQLITTDLDGANSSLREDGVQTDSGNAGTNNFGEMGIGYRKPNNDSYAAGYVGFIEVHEGAPSSGLQTREQEIADSWGITLS